MVAAAAERGSNPGTAAGGDGKRSSDYFTFGIPNVGSVSTRVWAEMVDRLKSTEAARPLCLPGTSAPPASGTCWLTHPVQLLLLLTTARCSRDTPLLYVASPIINRAESTAQCGRGGRQPGCLPSPDRVGASPGPRRPNCSASVRAPRVASPTGLLPTCRLQRLPARRAPTGRMKSSPPRAGSPHSVPAAGGEGPPPAAGPGAGSWGGRPLPLWVLVLFSMNAFAEEVPLDCARSQKSQSDFLCRAPVLRGLPCPTRRMDSSIPLCGFPTLFIFPVGAVHFAEFETGIVFRVEINVQRIWNV